MFGMSSSSRRLPAFCCNLVIRNGRRIRVRTNAVVPSRASSYATLETVAPWHSQRSTHSRVENPLAVAAGVLGKRPRARAVPVPRSSAHGRFVSTQTAPNEDASDDSTVPWRIAIVGSGPSGCYTAKYLMMGVSSKLSKPSSLSIDVIERLPTPYGLVRNGVAPDHPEVKNVQNDFDALFEETNDNSATTTSTTQQTIRFYGNVTVGGSSSDTSNTPSDVALDELRALYDVVVLAYGCESDRELNLPVDVLGEDGTIREDPIEASRVKGILSAREFVNWYNGHPDYEWVTSKVQDALGGGMSQNIVVVGHGNVALDCARILAKTRNSLDPTDLTTRALDVLRPESNDSDSNLNSNSIPRSISVVGRRGHVQAAFTIKEVRELTKLLATDQAEFVVREDELALGQGTEASQEELKARPRARIDKLLQGHAQQSSEAQTTLPSTTVHLRFLTNPIRFQAKLDDDTTSGSEQLKLTSVVCERTQLEGSTPGSQQAKGTGVTETIDADLCLVSIGYKGLPIDDSTSASFDDKRGILQNDHGKVILGNDKDASKNKHLAPLYVSGWLKRGPSGIIGTNIGDAKDTVASILKDLESGAISKQSSSPLSATSLEELLRERQIRFVDWDAYRHIEACESSDHPESNPVGHQKRHSDQPREKIVHRETLLRAAGK